MKIEIVTTPNQKLKETGFGDLNSCNDVLDAMASKGYDVKLSICNSANDLDNVVNRRPNLVVLAVKYIAIKDKDNIWLSDFFEHYHINYSGSSREVLKFDSNKALAKTHLRGLGISTADFFTAIPGQYQHENELPITFPLFLKPLDAANGNGIDDSSFVTNFSDFEKKVSSLYELYNVPVLAEEYLDGREFTVSILKKINGELIASPIEIVPIESKNRLRILGATAKKENSETLLKIKEEKIKNKVKELAIDAFINLGIRDFGRIDIKLDKNDKCFFMEANLIPGMTRRSSYFPKACEIANGMTYGNMVEQILDTCLHRPPLVISPRYYSVLNPALMVAST